jgi:hypothetical protein
MSAREERLGENESFFRRLNEHIDTVTEPPDSGYQQFLCECGDADCVVRLPLTRSEYESARSEPTTFIVAPGHVHHDVEVRVRGNDRFVLVRKFGEAGEVAIEQDPRS